MKKPKWAFSFLILPFLEIEENMKLNSLENRIGYQFNNKELLESALMHSSFTNEKRLPKYKCNERLEYLGDAVLELVSSEFLFHANECMPEGELTKLRASMVCEPSLALCARAIKLGDYLLLGKGEEATGGRDRDSIIADAMEAVIGAIYLDCGYAEAKSFVERFILNDLEKKHLFYDAKSNLQEWSQNGTDRNIRYELISESGPDHNKSFEVAVFVGEQLMGKGLGKSKKIAEQHAAYEALCKINEQI